MRAVRRSAPSCGSGNSAFFRYFILFAITTAGLGAASAEPGAEWSVLDPSADPRAAAQAAPVARAVEDYAGRYHPTALMVVHGDVVVATSGDIARKVNLHSVRKSLLSALFGIAVERGQVDLDKTMAQLGIDDLPPALTTAEKQASVRQLLMARSGVYHPAAYETQEEKRLRPARGAHAPGTYWYYNNWDFNALGAIYEKATGATPFEGFERLIARPIGMQDFTARDGVFVAEDSSLYRAYLFHMSARDLARFGLLYLDQGRWNGTQIVPSRWVAESTRAYSQTERKDRGYGYLWWTLDATAWGEGATLASGYGGQLMAILPAQRLIVVQVVASTRNGQGLGSRDFLDLVRTISTSVR
jgi:CubicO group peptidase (beta-lactamase class C family)